MASMSFLDFQYNMKKKFLRKPSRLFSRTRQNSGLTKALFQPNMDEMKQVLDKFDSNKDGKISQQEYKGILIALGIENTVGEVATIFRVIDVDVDGFINFKEFMEAHRHGCGIKTTDIQTAFRIFDANGDGKISAEEVMQMLRRLEMHPS